MPDIEDDEYVISKENWKKVVDNKIGRVKIIHLRTGIEYLKEIRDIQEMSKYSAFSFLSPTA